MSSNPASLATPKSTHPLPQMGSDALQKCIDACFGATAACVRCADACLAEESVAALRRCINLNLICADICATTGRTVSRLTETSEISARSQMVSACELTCQACAEECEKHAAMMDHCRVCAEACRRCERSCR